MTPKHVTMADNVGSEKRKGSGEGGVPLPPQLPASGTLYIFVCVCVCVCVLCVRVVCVCVCVCVCVAFL